MIKITINLKTLFYEDREMQDTMIEFYLIKRNLIISILFLIQRNCILSRLSSVQKGICHQSQRIAHVSEEIIITKIITITIHQV